MSRPFSSRAWRVGVLLAVALGVAVAGVPAQDRPYVYRYIGQPLDDHLGTGLVGPSNFITIEMTMQYPWCGTPEPLTWVMSDGARTANSGMSGAVFACDNVQHTTNEFGGCVSDLPVVWRCVAETRDALAPDSYNFHTNSAWDPYWPPFDWSDVTVNGVRGYGQTGAQGSWARVGFSLTASPTMQTVKAGKSASYQANVVLNGGFTETVSLSCESVPTAATCTITPGSNGAYVVTVNTRPGKKGTPKGTYAVTIRATAADLSESHDATVALTVK